MFADDVEELGGIFLVAVAVGADVCWARADRTVPVDLVGGVGGGGGLVVVAGIGRGLPSEDGSDVAVSGVCWSRRGTELWRLASAFNGVLEGVIQSVDPCVHVFFRWGLVDSLVLRRYHLETESTFSVACFSH